MIFTEITPGQQMLLGKWTCKAEGSVITLSEDPLARDFCLCLYECDYEELAFTSFDTPADTNDTYKNDYRKFLLNPKSVTAVFDFLIVDSSGNETSFDSTFGEVFPQGFNTEQPLQVGINVLWWKVADVLGHGNYTIKTTLTEFGLTATNESHKFVVCPFDTQRADQTIKIEVVNKGITMNGVNWDGLGEFINMARVNGRVSEEAPEIERETTVTTQREEIAYQTSIRSVYVIKIDNIPSVIGNVLVNEGAVMVWLVTDYNVFNYEEFRELPVEIESVTPRGNPAYSKRFFDVSVKKTDFKLNRPFI